MLYPYLRNVLFKLDPEVSHHLALKALCYLQRLNLTSLIAKPILYKQKTVMGIDFPNPVGLAAGLDKNAEYLDGLAALGFGFIEVGTVTPHAQPGNPKPRLFRLPKADALINRLGFNNQGLDYLIGQIQRAKYRGVLGVNIGKNAVTPNERAVDDYIIGLRGVYPYASYITVNLSSPNTPGLRELQHGKQREELFASLKEEQQNLAVHYNKYVPLVVKIAPDMDEEQVKDFAKSLLHHQIDGVIATNTTFMRPEVENLPHAAEIGGLSGRPLLAMSTLIIKQLKAILQNTIPIIGVGGIMSGEDAVAKIHAGAELVQIYTGLIYQGPALISEIAGSL